MFECTICTEEFNSTDEVVCTTCGHVFHQHCLRDWTNRSLSCPQCRSMNPGHHKIYLNFDEASRRLRDTMKLKETLYEKERQISGIDESHVVEISRLESELRHLEQICLKLNENNNVLRAENDSITEENMVKVTEIHDLEVKIQVLEGKLVLKDSENQQLQELLGNLTENNRQARTKESAENEKAGEEKKSAQLNLSECADLKHKLKCEVQEKIQLFEKNNTLEEKLKQIQLQLQREIRHSTELSVDKMRLQSMLERTGASGGSTELRDSKQKVGGDKCCKDKVHEKKAVKKEVVDGAASVAHELIRNAVIIKGCKVNVSPQETVRKIAQQLLLPIGEDDIEQTVVRHRPNNILLIVGFKTKFLKDLFLANAGKLKHYQETQHFEVCAYSAITDLLAYAKKLKSVGYKNVLKNKDYVYARADNKSTPIKIFNKETVDKLMQCGTKSTTNPLDAPNEKLAEPLTAVTQNKPGESHHMCITNPRSSQYLEPQLRLRRTNIDIINPSLTVDKMMQCRTQSATKPLNAPKPNEKLSQPLTAVTQNKPGDSHHLCITNPRSSGYLEPQLPLRQTNCYIYNPSLTVDKMMQKPNEKLSQPLTAVTQNKPGESHHVRSRKPRANIDIIDPSDPSRSLIRSFCDDDFYQL